MRTYDIVLANIDEFFSARIREFSAQAGPSFFLVEPVWVEELLGRVEAGDIGVRMLIDMASDCYREGDPYYRLACTVKGAGGYVINDPDRSHHDSQGPLPQGATATRATCARHHHCRPRVAVHISRH